MLSVVRLESQIILKSFGAKGLNWIARTDYDHAYQGRRTLVLIIITLFRSCNHLDVFHYYKANIISLGIDIVYEINLLLKFIVLLKIM